MSSFCRMVASLCLLLLASEKQRATALARVQERE